MDEPEERDRLIKELESRFGRWTNPEARLTQALENDELQLFAQPILSLAQPGVFPLAEVLVRLTESGATLPPADFLRVFEHHGMLPALDRWVFRNVAAELVKGSAVPRLTINVSSQSVGADFLADVAAELQSVKVSPSTIVLEVTEELALERPGSAKDFAAKVRELGFQLALSGFGRRAVSFAPILGLRPDFVKVDGVVVRGLESSEFAQSKLTALVDACKLMNIAVIAECAETIPVLECLRGIGVTFAQGNAIQRPGPIASVLRK